MKLEMVVYMIHEYNLDATIRDPKMYVEVRVSMCCRHLYIYLPIYESKAIILHW